MALWQELIAKWEQEETVCIDDDPFNPDDDPEWYNDDQLEDDPFDPAGEELVDLFGIQWE